MRTVRDVFSGILHENANAFEHVCVASNTRVIILNAKMYLFTT